jgi:hypothetical protein
VLRPFSSSTKGFSFVKRRNSFVDERIQALKASFIKLQALKSGKKVLITLLEGELWLNWAIQKEKNS